MTARSWRRLGASVAAITVAATLTTISAPAHAETPPAVTDGSSWLSSQLSDGAVVGEYGPDYGLSIDAANALRVAGGHDDEVDDVYATLRDHIGDYMTGEAYGDTGSTYSGPAAKALVFIQSFGVDTTPFTGGLVDRLMQQIVTSGPSKGRLFDTSTFGDYANTLGQAYAARGLAKANPDQSAPDSVTPVDVLKYLFEQQCPAGYFRLNFTKNRTAADQTCAGGRSSGASPADPDTTATVLLQLDQVTNQLSVARKLGRVVGKAEAWLLNQQHADGSFSGGTSTDVPNANSTGLAGWALGELGDTNAAARAAVWIRQHQVQPIAECPTKLDDEAGAIAYDGAALAAGRKTGITDALQDQWRRATAQALPALQWLPENTDKPKLAVPAGYRKAGSKVVLRATGATPGSTLCLRVGSNSALATAGSGGSAHAKVVLPNGTAHRVARLTDGTTTRSARIKVLGKKKLAVTTRKKAKRGTKVTVRIAGLAPHEKLTVRRNGKVIRHASAGAKGKFYLKAPVGRKLGKVTIKVTGQFPATRKGTTSVKVHK